MKHLVLLGGGHAHLFVLELLAKQKPDELQVTLVSPSRWHYYSGMLPGWMATHYSLDACRIDLLPLAHAAGVELLETFACNLDANSQTVTLQSGQTLHFDLLSLDTGSETVAAALSGLGDKLVTIKPLATFIQQWTRIKKAATNKPDFHLLVVGGGAGGVELAFAARQTLTQQSESRHSNDKPRVSLIAGTAGLLPGYTEKVRQRVSQTMTHLDIAIVTQDASGIEVGVLLADGMRLQADAVIAATGASAPDWLHESGLQLDDDGFVQVDACHRSISHANIFAAGDVCSREDSDLPVNGLQRSGVHAVRAGPVLADNLLAALQESSLRPYKPRSNVLYLLSCGNKSAISAWGKWSAQGAWVWRWKDYIDRAFIRRFTVAPQYGHWPSSLTAEKVFQASESISYLRTCAHGIFFLLSLPGENNCLALMHRSVAGKITRVSPTGINVRSRLQEYGGLPYTFTDDTVFYCNFRDQRIMRQAFDQLTGSVGDCVLFGPPESVKADLLRYADFIVDNNRNRLICVREDHRGDDKEPVNALVAIDMQTGGEGEILFAGTDFVASPALSTDGRLLAFQTWSHPNMPWDITQIRIAELNATGCIVSMRQVAQDQVAQEGEVAMVQPAFNANGDLYFIADWSDWWNLYRVEAKELAGDCKAVEVLPMAAEFCGAQWQLGMRNYDFLDDDNLVVSINRDCFWELASIKTSTRELKILESGLGLLENLNCRNGKVYYTAASATEVASLRERSIESNEEHRLFTCSRSDGLDVRDISVPEHITYPTTDSEVAHGMYYAPLNAACVAPSDTLPPLLVLVHGGPTGNARVAFNPAVQFWTSRGFAVLDINHRGSTGYGRKFRHRLYGDWGVVDVADVDSAVCYLIASEKVDADKIAIRGGSAGGYVVLATLAKSELFSAGVSYYGVCDLEMLAKDTHKFESRYLDQLIGPYPAARQVYLDRSPLYQIDGIKAAVLLLQGQEDKVVPPNQAEAIYEKLRQRNPATRYLSFADEGHGFRKPQNQIAALDTELAFYQANLL